MRALKVTFLSAVLLFLLSGFSVADGDSFYVMFYNMENLFDTIDNPNTADDEFTPDGDRHWNSYRYRRKLVNLWKSIASANNTKWPDIIGVSEVENRQVLIDLVLKTPLGVGKYSIFHKESLDRRGIDVAIMYRPETFMPIDTGFIRVSFPKDPDYHTRDILYMKGVRRSSRDTLTVFVNHWPSRYGGLRETNGYRCTCAKVLRNVVDSILGVNPDSKILIMGDLNDTPYNESVNKHLKAEQSMDMPDRNKLYNISYYLSDQKGYWTYWYKGRGDFLDQVIVSGALLNPDNGFYINPDRVYPIQDKFLRDDNGRPLRTFMGPRYLGGYSDHLPVVINFDLQKQADKLK